MGGAEFVNQVGEHCSLGDTGVSGHATGVFLFISVMSCNFSAPMRSSSVNCVPLSSYIISSGVVLLTPC